MKAFYNLLQNLLFLLICVSATTTRRELGAIADFMENQHVAPNANTTTTSYETSLAINRFMSQFRPRETILSKKMCIDCCSKPSRSLSKAYAPPFSGEDVSAIVSLSSTLTPLSTSVQDDPLNKDHRHQHRAFSVVELLIETLRGKNVLMVGDSVALNALHSISRTLASHIGAADLEPETYTCLLDPTTGDLRFEQGKVRSQKVGNRTFEPPTLRILRVPSLNIDIRLIKTYHFFGPSVRLEELQPGFQLTPMLLSYLLVDVDVLLLNFGRHFDHLTLEPGR